MRAVVLVLSLVAGLGVALVCGMAGAVVGTEVAKPGSLAEAMQCLDRAKDWRSMGDC
jgi:uncharacterized membrane protein